MGMKGPTEPTVDPRANEAAIAKSLADEVAALNTTYPKMGLEFTYNPHPPYWQCIFRVERNGIMLCQASQSVDLRNDLRMFELGWNHARGALGYETMLETGDEDALDE